MPQGKLRAVGRGPVHREHPVSVVAGDFLYMESAANRKGVRDAALFRFRCKHENLPKGRKSASQGVHIRATYPIVVRDEDTRFPCFLHVI